LEQLVLAVLGPYANWIMTLSLGLVIWKRKVIDRRHIVILLVLSILSLVGFFAFLIYGMAHWPGSPEVFQHLLGSIAALTVGSSSAIGFWVILKSFGLTRPEQ